MRSELHIKANRLNAQKSAGPQTVEGNAKVSQKAIKHGLFARENVICCEKMSDFVNFRQKLLAGPVPAGGVEATPAERIVSSLDKVMGELQRLQRVRTWEQAEVEQAIPPLGEAAIHLEGERIEFEKQSQCRPSAGISNFEILNPKQGLSRCSLVKQSQYQPSAGNPKFEILNPKQGHACAKQSQFA